MERIHQFAHQHLKMSNDSQKKNYDHRPVNQHRYNRGDAVWLYSPKRKKGVCPKLMRHFDGSFLVITRLSDILYCIQKGPKSKPKVVHHDRLKAYHGPNAPDWLTASTLFDQTSTPPGSDAVKSTSDLPGVEQDPISTKRCPRRAARPPVRMGDYKLY